MIDMKKIGAFLAERRKALGLTQRQLAERLGMSDKSVSKWERGVCLPDVSVYTELCGILGISLNEFLAGEAISREQLAVRAEENLLEVSADGSRRQKRLRRIIAALSVLVVAAGIVLGVFLCRAARPQNWIAPLPPESDVMRTAQALSAGYGAYLYRYRTDDPFTTIAIDLSEYHFGELVSQRQVAWLSWEGMDSPAGGMIAILPDFTSPAAKLVLSSGGTWVSKDLSLGGITPGDTQNAFCFGALELEETAIRYDEEQPLLALICCNGRNLWADDLSLLARGEAQAKNDTVYYFSIRFGK